MKLFNQYYVNLCIAFATNKSRISKLSILISVLFFSGFSGAESSIYGKLNMDLAAIKQNSKIKNETINNASRIGFKSSLKLSDTLEFSFQIENEIDPTDGKADGDKVLKQRNTFIGLSGNFGNFFIGTHDTAFKKAQLKIDLFNDTSSDIKKLFHGENRMNDLVGYTTPEFFKDFTITVNKIGQSDISYQSISFDYSGKIVKSSFAIDSGAKGYDSKRVSLLIPINKTTIGFMFQNSKHINSNKNDSGHLISLDHRLSSKGSLKIQNSVSDMKIEGGRQKSIGYNYKINNVMKVFTTLSKLNKDLENSDIGIFSIGFEFNF
jgi:predicted porin